MATKTETAYVYKWIHLPTYRWYVGVRYAQGCHPNDGYICSSKTVRPLIEANPSQWKREILAIGSVADMRNLEEEILNLFYDKNDTRCLNQNVAHHPPIHRGNTHPMFGKVHSDETRLKQSEARKKLYADPEFSEKQQFVRIREGAKRRGISIGPHPESRRLKISTTLRSDISIIENCRVRAAAMKGVPNTPLCKPVVGFPIDGGPDLLRFISAGEAGRSGFTQASVSKCCLGRRSSHKGYRWRYATEEEIIEYFKDYADKILSRD